MPFWKGSKGEGDQHGRRMERQQGSRAVDPGDAKNHRFYSSLDSDAAETTLIEKVEERGRNTSTGSDGFRPAVDGERVPLGVDNLGRAFGDDESQRPIEGIKRTSFKNMANKVRDLQKVARTNRQASQKALNAPADDENGHGHRRAQTLLASIDESSPNNDEIAVPGVDPFGLRQHVDEFEDIGNFWEQLDTSFDVDGTLAPLEVAAEEHAESVVGPEGRPLLGDQSDGRGQPTVRITRHHKMKRYWKNVSVCLNPLNLLLRFVDWMSSSTLLLAFPCWIVAWVLYYRLGNPQLDFLPGTASLSWWANFIGKALLSDPTTGMQCIALTVCFLY
jgi:hypothetical protein